jgi:hypothetical protein
VVVSIFAPAQSSYIGLSCFCSNGLLPFNIRSSLPDFIFHCRLLSEPHWLCHFAPRRSMVVPIIFQDNLDRKMLDHIGVSFSGRRMERRLPDFITCIGSRSSSRVTILNFPGFTLITCSCSNIRIVCFALSLVLMSAPPYNSTILDLSSMFTAKCNGVFYLFHLPALLRLWFRQ